MALLNKKCLCIITGASQGIGKEICLQLAKIVGSQSQFLITARSEKKLNDMKAEMETFGDISIEIIECDLKEIDSNIDKFLEYFKNIQSDESFDAALMIHNAGTIGQIDVKVGQMSDPKEWREYLEINLISMVLLNNAFLTNIIAKMRMVVNITSLFAIKGVESFGFYSAGKAAREALMRVQAAEEPEIRILNYSPGPVETAMTNEIISNSCNTQIKEQFEKEIELLTCEQTVKKLITIINENNFKSGSRIDFFD